MKTNAEIQRICNVAGHEASDEMNLPDYMPEIGRIVSCSSSVLPESRYIDRGELVLSGLIIVCVYYVGDNEELCAFPHNCEYTLRLPCTGCDMSGISVDRLIVKTSVENTLCRATGPRRLSLTVKLRSSVFASQPDVMLLETSSGDITSHTESGEASLELLKAPFEYTRIFCGSTSGSLSGELNERADGRIVSCEGTATITSATVVNTEVSLKGELYISCLATDDSGKYFTLQARAPIDETVGIGEIMPDATRTYAVGRARCAAVKVHGEENGKFAWEAEYDIEAFAFADMSGEIISDAYSTEFSDNCELSKAKIVRCLAGVNTRLSANASRQSALARGREVSYISARVADEIAECTAEGRFVLSGNCAVTVIIANGDELGCEELSVPYRFECECKRGESPAIISDVSVICAEARLDGERLSVSCELSVSCIALECAEKSYVSRVVLEKDDSIHRRTDSLVLYYPTEDETEWDIGKKYHCRRSSVRVLDGIDAVMIKTK